MKNDFSITSSRHPIVKQSAQAQISPHVETQGDSTSSSDVNNSAINNYMKTFKTGQHQPVPVAIVHHSSEKSTGSRLLTLKN